MKHPNENDLALHAGGDLGFFRSFAVARHLRECSRCSEMVQEYRDLTTAISGDEDVPDWNNLAAEMRANIRLGLEAGACIDCSVSEPTTRWSPRLAVALASLTILVGANFVLRPKPVPTLTAQQSVHVDTEGVTITSVFGE